MTDDLLDEATRLADRLHDVDPPEVRVLRALVERVQGAEAARDSWHQAALLTTADLGRVERERDEARAKLDTVRQGLVDEIAKFEHGDSEEGWPVHNLRNVLAIIDGKYPEEG
jgi:hypothetical protein